MLGLQVLLENLQEAWEKPSGADGCVEFWYRKNLSHSSDSRKVRCVYHFGIILPRSEGLPANVPSNLPDWPTLRTNSIAIA